MLLKVILLIVGIGAIQAESPRRAPYAPSGWHPDVPFNLPSDFLPQVGSTVEITKARVEHAGTINVPQENLAKPLAPQIRPVAQYGAPADDGFRINYPEEDDTQSSTELPNIREGRYYIVASDNKLQRVVYRTEDSADNGFTAQLKYSLVGELQDPVYRYNNQGHLERVLK